MAVSDPFEYPAFRSVQNATAKDLILFDAPATEIAQWAGIPQRGRMNNEETVGFQRQQDLKRVAAISAFFSEENNIIQNPLLCAAQALTDVTFTPTSDDGRYGVLRIAKQNLMSFSLGDLLKQLQKKLELRMPHLTSESVTQDRYTEALNAFNTQQSLLEVSVDSSGELEENPGEESEPADADSEEELNSLLSSDESLIVEFYREVKLRVDHDAT